MDDLTRQAEALGPWFHNIRLPNGYETNPSHPFNPFHIWRAAVEPFADLLRGKTVLDVGCNGGYMEISLNALGCQVDAIDKNPLYCRQTEFIKQVFNLSCTVRQADLLNAPLSQYDVVLFCGVLYHVEDPLGAFRRVLAAGDHLIMETAIADGGTSLWEYRNWDGNYKNTFVPTLPAVHKMVSVCEGEIIFENVYAPSRAVYLIRKKKCLSLL